MQGNGAGCQAANLQRSFRRGPDGGTKSVRLNHSDAETQKDKRVMVGKRRRELLSLWCICTAGLLPEDLTAHEEGIREARSEIRIDGQFAAEHRLLV
jgi:hypothetical protein